tara:strand:+ start:5023 stop:5232 length:210 start_codon:yes stop_codon:yes gene_type:complete
LLFLDGILLFGKAGGKKIIMKRISMTDNLQVCLKVSEYLFLENIFIGSWLCEGSRALFETRKMFKVPIE